MKPKQRQTIASPMSCKFPRQSDLTFGTVFLTFQRAFIHTLPSQQAGSHGIICPTLQLEKLRHRDIRGPTEVRQQSQTKTPSLLPASPGPHLLQHYAIWQNFPGFSPWTAISFPTHQRNVNCTACFGSHQENANSQPA